MQAATRYNGRTENIRGEPKKCPMKDHIMEGFGK